MNIKIIIKVRSIENIQRPSIKHSLVIVNNAPIVGYNVDLYCRDLIKSEEFKEMHRQYFLYCSVSNPIRKICLITLPHRCIIL